MRLVDDRGRELGAEYFVKADGGYLALVMESRSGRSARGRRGTLTTTRALTVLLARLGRLNAVLIDALVDSRHTQELGLPEADRRLIQAPIRLALEPDADALRRRLGTAQAKIAQVPGATKGGNSTKRVRLRVDVPAFSRVTPPGWRRHWRRLSRRPLRRGRVTGGSTRLARTSSWR